MTKFIDLNWNIQTLILIWNLLLLLVSIYVLVRFSWIGTGKLLKVSQVVIIGSSFFLLMVLTDAVRFRFKGDILNYVPLRLTFEIPWIAAVLALAVISAGLSFTLFMLKIWGDKNPTPFTIKESLDSLSVGVCFHSFRKVKLINHAMESFLTVLTGHPQPDLYRLFMYVKNTYPDMIVPLDDGRVIMFSEKQLMTGKTPVYELTAQEITEEYAVSKELEAQNEKIRLMNERLQELNENITVLTTQSEILSAKAKLHNDLGALSLAARMYMEQDPKDPRRTRDELLSMWIQTYDILESQTSREKAADEFKVIFGAAEDIGFGIHLEGELPGDKTARKILSTAMHECMVNGIRHGCAKNLAVKVEGDWYSTKFTLTNDGKTPESDIRETGGLLHLKELVQDRGGLMETISRPAVTVSITLPIGSVPED